MTLNREAAARSDLGLVRRNNQDSFAIDEHFGLYVICDGMGGAAGGEVASRIAADTFVTIARQELSAERVDSPAATQRALHRAAVAANRAVLTKANFDHRYRGMGSTLVGVRIADDHAVAVNVGDSRAYLLHRDHLKQLTRDHSYLSEQVQLGLITVEQAAASNMQSLITRAIGAESDVHPDLFQFRMAPGDAVLLTSDGLTRHVSDQDIRRMLHAPTPDDACLRLIDAAREDGGSDNITCCVIRIASS